MADTVIVRPSRGQLALNEAYLAFEAGKLQSADLLLADLCAALPPGDTRSKALVLFADCAMQRLEFGDAADRCTQASAEAALLPTVDDREIASARVSLARSRCYFLLSDYQRAHLELARGTLALSRLQAPPDARRSELLRALSIRQAELALHLGDVAGALEHVRSCKYAAGSNDAICEATFDLASIESGTESFSGRFESALALIEQAYAAAQRLGFNYQVVRFAIERAWVKTILNPVERLPLARELAALAKTLQVPYLSLEAALFCAANEKPASAMQYATKARASVPSSSEAMTRAILAQSAACFRLGRFTDALDLAAEVESLSRRLGNNRTRASALALMAEIRVKSGDSKAALTLKRNAEELLRLHGAAGEIRRYREGTKAS